MKMSRCKISISPGFTILRHSMHYNWWTDTVFELSGNVITGPRLSSRS